MNWQDMIKFNKEHLGNFVDNKEFWKRFNELEELFEVIDDDLRDYERIKYITINEFLLKTKIDDAIEYIKHYETIRGYYEYEECGYDEYNYEEDLKEELLELLKEN